MLSIYHLRGDFIVRIENFESQSQKRYNMPMTKAELRVGQPRSRDIELYDLEPHPGHPWQKRSREEVLAALTAIGKAEHSPFPLSPFELYGHDFISESELTRQTTFLKPFLRANDIPLGERHYARFCEILSEQIPGSTGVLPNRWQTEFRIAPSMLESKVEIIYQVAHSLRSPQAIKERPGNIQQNLQVNTEENAEIPSQDALNNLDALPQEYAFVLRLLQRGIRGEIIGELLGGKTASAVYTVAIKARNLLNPEREKRVLRSSPAFNQEIVLSEWAKIRMFTQQNFGRLPTVADLRQAYAEGKMTYTDTTIRKRLGNGSYPEAVKKLKNLSLEIPFEKTVEFVIQAISQGAHLRKHPNITDSNWAQTLNILFDNLGAKGSAADLAIRYRIGEKPSRQSVSERFRFCLNNLWKNSPEETQALYHPKSFSFKRPPGYVAKKLDEITALRAKIPDYQAA